MMIKSRTQGLDRYLMKHVIDTLIQEFGVLP